MIFLVIQSKESSEMNLLNTIIKIIYYWIY